MASILDSREEIEKVDKKNVYGSVLALGDQVEDAWEQVSKLEIKIDAGKVRNIVVAAMGGSALGPDVIKRALKAELHLPLEIVNDYALPGYVNEFSLVILSSYSGTTEETLSALKQAQELGAQVLIITTGGDLAKHMKEHNTPGYIIKVNHNPSDQPRMAIGYSVFGIIALLTKAGILKLTDSDINGVIATIRRLSRELNVEVAQDDNGAKQMAFQMLQRVPVLIAAEHLEGAVHVFQNQLNENAKTYAEYRVLPELNHHLMEGLRFPDNNEGNFFFVLINSSLYNERTQKRVLITQTVLENAKFDTIELHVVSGTRLEQAFEIITFGAFTNFYLAMLEGIDPAPISTVDFFKEQLGK
jgi:glucose/mannose-6-phosphate isomerase